MGSTFVGLGVDSAVAAGAGWLTVGEGVALGTTMGDGVAVAAGSEGWQPMSRARVNPATVHRIAFMFASYVPTGCFPPLVI